MAKFEIKATIVVNDIEGVDANLLADNVDEMVLKEIGLRNLPAVVELVETEVHEIVE